VFASYLEALDEAFGPGAPGIERENLQARIRGNILMALSNKFGWLVISTGNKSEVAVGYCTLYGDMTGGLAAISDVPKTLVYRLAHYINQHGEIIPPNIIARPPSAELKPNQTDQDTLPPYDVLDAVLAGYLEEHKKPREIIAAGYDRRLVREIIRRVEQNEYKREQAPPGLKITLKAFGLGRRMPLAQHYY
jgi:NAD+ synthetase